MECLHKSFVYSAAYFLQQTPTAGTPAREKEYMAGTPAIEWWYGRDSHKKRAVTPANLRGCEFDKKTWKRRKKKREKLVSRDSLHKCVLDSVTTYVWFKSLKLCLAILLYCMDDWSYKTLEKLLIDVWKWPLEVPIWCLCVSDDIEWVWANPGWPRPWVSGVTAVGFCPQSRPWVCQSHGRDSA